MTTSWKVCRKRCYSASGNQSHPPFPWLCYHGNDLIAINKEYAPPIKCPYQREHEIAEEMYMGAQIAWDVAVTQDFIELRDL